MDKLNLAHGALPTPEAEKATAWTLASVGAPVTYPSAAILEHVRDMVVSMQGQIGCCVGCTYEEIVRLIVFLTTGKWEDLSFRFVYAMCKAVEGKKVTLPNGVVIDATMYYRTAGANDGTYPALAAMIVRKVGVPLASIIPNDVNMSADAFCYQRDIKNIPVAAFADAATRKAGADMTTCACEEGIKQAINYARANKGSVAILRRVGNEYWTRPDGTSTWDKKDLMPLRAPNPVSSGHEEMLYGYIDITPAERAALQADSITIESLIAKYGNSNAVDATRTETVILWLNHWSRAWASTGGNSADGGYGYEFLDIWLPFVGEVRVSVTALPPAPDNFRYDFTKQMKDNDKGADVVALQHVLSIEGCYDYTGTPLFTGNYGSYTHAGVKKLQEKYAAEILTPLHLTHGTGVVGASTLAWLQKHYTVSNSK